MTLAPGTRLGPYEILSPLGSGGMGEVWKARDTRLDRFVAVKVLPEHLARNPESLARFEREAKAVAALNHPNITGIHDFATQGDTTYVVMELLEGESLRSRLEQGLLTPRKATELAIQMAQGLAAAHEKGVVHRDLKPDNLWITRDGRLKILDFGLAKQVTAMGTSSNSLQPTAAFSPGHLTEKGMLLGTLGYMSPEQVRGESVDARSDIFSFGVVLYEMLTGRRAFARDSAPETLAAILQEEPPALTASGSSLPQGLRGILDHCLEKIPARRFREAQDLAFALENALGTSSAEVAPVVSAPSPSRRWGQALVAVLLAALGAMGGWWAHSPRPEPNWTQLTFRRGQLKTARFTPDGQSVVYSASWEDKPSEVFLARLDGKATRSLGLTKAAVVAVNTQGEMLVLLRDEKLSGNGLGTLALVPLEGGEPRELLARVSYADFGPDGKEIAAIYQPVPGGPERLDFPLGKTLFQREIPSMDGVRVSPKGDSLAFTYYDADTDTQVLALVDRQGKRRELHRFSRATGNNILNTGPVWTPDGQELYFNSGELLRAVDLKGRLRTLAKDSALYSVLDVSIHGRVLRERVLAQKSVVVRRESREMDLSISNWAYVAGLSADGGQALINAFGSVGGETGMVGVRRTDGGPPKFLGPGSAQDQSPDGKWVIIQPPGVTEHFNLVSTGLGPSRELRHPGWALQGAFFLADSHHVLVAGRSPKGSIQYLRFSIEGGPAEELTARVSFELTFSSGDGLQLLVLDEQHRPVLRPLDGGPDKVLAAALGMGETLAGWDLQDRLLIRQASKPASVAIDLLDLRTGFRKPWQVLGPADSSLVTHVSEMAVSTDFKTLVYSYRRVITSDLFVMEGLK